jgi:Zn-dependent peptidase ImmA (M78 family)
MWNKIVEAGKLVGLDADELCHRAHISPKQKKTVKTEGGKLTVAQVTRLADQTGLPLSFYFQNVLPANARTKSKLRHDFNTDQTNDPPADEIAYLRVRELFRMGTLVDTMLKTKAYDAKKADMPGITGKVTAKDIAEALGLEKAHAPIGPKLAASLRERGLIFLVYPIYNKAKMGGASWWHTDDVPVAAVDSHYGEGRGFFTLAHEAVHIIHHLPSKEAGHTCRLDPFMASAALKAEERQTNEIASQLLMPISGFAEAKKTITNLGVHEGITILSQEWKVSRQALGIRLVEWDVLKDDQIRFLFVRKKRDPEKKSSGSYNRPFSDRFGSPAVTSDLVYRLYDGGASARFIEWSAKLPYEFVHETINKAENVAAGSPES